MDGAKFAWVGCWPPPCLHSFPSPVKTGVFVGLPPWGSCEDQINGLKQCLGSGINQARLGCPALTSKAWNLSSLTHNCFSPWLLTSVIVDFGSSGWWLCSWMLQRDLCERSALSSYFLAFARAVLTVLRMSQWKGTLSLSVCVYVHV